MARILVLLVVVFLCSCRDKYGLTKEEIKSIEIDISIHNMRMPMKWTKARIEREMAIRQEFKEAVWLGQLKLEDIESHPDYKRKIEQFLDSLTNPYKIEYDTALTLRSYLDYCSAYKLDPKTYLSVLNR